MVISRSDVNWSCFRLAFKIQKPDENVRILNVSGFPMFGIWIVTVQLQSVERTSPVFKLCRRAWLKNGLLTKLLSNYWSKSGLQTLFLSFYLEVQIPD